MRLMCASLLVAGLFALGCARLSTPTGSTVAVRSEEHGHEHAKDKMKQTHAGKYHAWLTAHLSKKDGNELDIFFESEDHENPAPAPIPVTKFSATAKRVSDDKEFELTFEPAPMEERKGDPAGACSHFVAKAPWMTRDDVLTVTAQLDIDGKPRKPTWKTFEVKKYAHHEE